MLRAAVIIDEKKTAHLVFHRIVVLEELPCRIQIRIQSVKIQCNDCELRIMLYQPHQTFRREPVCRNICNCLQSKKGLQSKMEGTAFYRKKRTGTMEGKKGFLPFFRTGYMSDKPIHNIVNRIDKIPIFIKISACLIRSAAITRVYKLRFERKESIFEKISWQLHK